jgi:hypothetical protein
MRGISTASTGSCSRAPRSSSPAKRKRWATSSSTGGRITRTTSENVSQINCVNRKVPTVMEIIIAIIAIIVLIAAIWFARVLDTANRLDAPEVPKNHPDQRKLEDEFNKAVNARHNDAEVDAWVDSVELSPSVMEGESIQKLAVGYSYPVRFQKKDGSVRDYVSFTVVFVQTLRSGDIFYTGIDGCPSDPSTWRVVGMTHKQLMAVWAGTIISPGVIVNMRDEIKIRNNPNL